MNGTEYADLFTTGQYGRLYLVSCEGGKKFQIQYLPEGEIAIPNGIVNLCLNENAKTVYGPAFGVCDWLEDGPWQVDFYDLVSNFYSRMGNWVSSKSGDTHRGERMAGQTEHILQFRLGVRKGQECHKCHGFGKINYSHGSTWRGGVGPTGGGFDTCNHCWGSGKESSPGVNLKELESEWMMNSRLTRIVRSFLSHQEDPAPCAIGDNWGVQVCKTHWFYNWDHEIGWECPVQASKEILKEEVKDER